MYICSIFILCRNIIEYTSREWVVWESGSSAVVPVAGGAGGSPRGIALQIPSGLHCHPLLIPGLLRSSLNPRGCPGCYRNVAGPPPLFWARRSSFPSLPSMLLRLILPASLFHSSLRISLIQSSALLFLFLTFRSSHSNLTAEYRTLGFLHSLSVSPTVCSSVSLSVYLSSLFLAVSVCLYLLLFISLAVFLSDSLSLSVSLSLCLSFCLSLFLSPSVCLFSLLLFVHWLYLFLTPSLCLSVCLSVSLSVSLSVFLTVSRSLCRYLALCAASSLCLALFFHSLTHALTHSLTHSIIMFVYYVRLSLHLLVYTSVNLFVSM